MRKVIKDNKDERASSGQDPRFGASAAEFVKALTIDKILPAEQIMKIMKSEVLRQVCQVS